jgi:hypothetical protein
MSFTVMHIWIILVREIIRVIKNKPELHDLMLGYNCISFEIKEANKQTLARKMNAFFKKAILATGLSLKSFDNILNDMDDDNLTGNTNGDWIWIIRESIMRHRIQLHNELDLLIKEQHKLSQITENTSFLDKVSYA